VDFTMKKARVALIGAGWWAVENHLPLLKARQDVELVALCTAGAENLVKVQRAFDIPFGTENYQELLTHQPLDGVVISSPHVWHFAHAKAALERGCHVLVEKPFTTSASQAKELIQLEREHRVTIVVPFGYNFSDLAAAAAENVHLIGAIRSGTLHMASATASLFLGERVTWAHGALVEPEPSTWADASKAGGFGWGQLSHALGLLFLLVDSEPEGVYAQSVNAKSGVDLFDAGTLTLESGAIVALSGASGLVPSAKPQLSLRLFGESGHLYIDFEQERLEIQTFSGQLVRPDFPPGAGGYTCNEPVNYFVDVCLGQKGRNPASGVIGCRSTEVLDALYRSAASGRPEAA
jgi:predicted dehydrogenase